MDYELAIQDVRMFLADLDSQSTIRDQLGPERALSDPRYRILEQGIIGQIPTIELIAEEIDSRLAERIRHTISTQWGWRHSGQQEAAVELLAVLKAHGHHESLFGVQRPRLDAARMHPWVWEAAARLWEGGNRRAAVQQAAAAIFDGHFPALLHISKGTMAPLDMVNMALADQPQAGKAYLQLPGDVTSADYRNILKGSRHLGQACCEMVRNLYAHDPAVTDEPDEVEALEALAMLSMANVVPVATDLSLLLMISFPESPPCGSKKSASCRTTIRLPLLTTLPWWLLRHGTSRARAPNLIGQKKVIPSACFSSTEGMKPRGRRWSHSLRRSGSASSIYN
jgi:hypothetical protein